MKDISKWNIMRDMQVKSMKAGFTCILLNKRKDILLKTWKKKNYFSEKRENQANIRSWNVIMLLQLIYSAFCNDIY